MEEFYGWIKSIVVFLLLTSLIYQMIPDSAYKKYVKVCTGLMLMIVTVWPLMQWTGAVSKMSYFLGLENVKIDAMDFNQMSQGAENEKARLITKNYKTQLEQQVLSMFEGSDIYPVQAEISIVEDMDSEDYGRVKEIYIVAVSDAGQIGEALKQEGKTAVTVAPVEQVSVPEVNVSEETAAKRSADNAVNEINSDEVMKVRNRIANALYIDEEHVNIDFR